MLGFSVFGVELPPGRGAAAYVRAVFSRGEVAEYYDTTQVHYDRWWGLRQNLSLHYGIWDEDTASLAEALTNTNRVLLEAADIGPDDRVLDAGCGVGGAGLYVHETAGAEVVGISLSERQVARANAEARRRGVETRVAFQVMDFTATSFPAESFDVVWSCESICHVERAAFVAECVRLLRPGGRMVITDYFLADEASGDPRGHLRKWQASWAMTPFVRSDRFAELLRAAGLRDVEVVDYTEAIRRTSRRMYLAALAAALPSELYNALHPGVSRFARAHYKSGYHQYRALRAGLWRYRVVRARK